MSQTYFAILTAIGEAKLANAISFGTQLQVSRMAVGDGNGALPVPIRTQTALVHETYRADLNSLMVDPINASQIIAELVIPDVEGGYWLREMGLYDAAGDLIAVANCPPSYKPVLGEGSGRTQVMRMVLVVASTTAIQLKIDPSVVLATRAYVDQKVLEELNKQDFKHSVLVATSGPIALNGLQTIDGIAVTAGKRVLVKDQAAGKDNGIYVVAAGAWPRAEDADVSTEVTPGLFVHVEQGTANSDSVWQLTTDAPITLGTTALTFEMISGRTSVAAGTYRSVTVDKNGRVIGGTNPTTLAASGIVDAYTKAEVEAMIAQASALPVGAIMGFPVDKVPPGFLEIDGSVKSIATYPDLNTFLGGAFNTGNEGAGNFRLPESRGEFLRGWDHGRGVDTGRAVGSWQKGSVMVGDFDENGGNSGFTITTLSTVSYAKALASCGLDAPVLGDYPTVAYVATNGGSYALTAGYSGVTRPRNLAVMWCIKAWNAPINQGVIDVGALAAEVHGFSTKLSLLFKTVTDVKASRAINVEYRNERDVPIIISIGLTSTAANQTAVVLIEGKTVLGSSYPSSGLSLAVVAPVPAGGTYKIPAGSYTISTFLEFT